MVVLEGGWGQRVHEALHGHGNSDPAEQHQFLGLLDTAGSGRTKAFYLLAKTVVPSLI